MPRASDRFQLKLNRSRSSDLEPERWGPPRRGDEMKIGASILALAFAAILTAGGACCAAEDRSPEKVEEDETIVVGIDGDFRPFTFIDEDGNSSGFDVESARWIADEMGFEVVFKPVV